MPDLSEEPKILSREELALVVEKGIEKWMDKRMAEVGKWTLRYIGIAIFGALMGYFASKGASIK